MSFNSNSSRPSVSFSLPYALKERLDKIPAGEKSSVAEAALTQYLDQKDIREKADNKLQAAALALYESRDTYGQELADVNGKIQALYDHVVFQTGVIETLFGLKKNPPPPIVVTNSAYEQVLKEAMVNYATDPALVSPLLQPEVNSLEDAADLVKSKNRLKEAEDMIDGMPFMKDQRFYRKYGSMGPAIFDRNFKEPSYVEGVFEDRDFSIVNIEVYNSENEITVGFPEARPYFKLHKLDYRKCKYVRGRDAVASVLPLIIADYVAYRRFKKDDEEHSLSERTTE